MLSDGASSAAILARTEMRGLTTGRAIFTFPECPTRLCSLGSAGWPLSFAMARPSSPYCSSSGSSMRSMCPALRFSSSLAAHSSMWGMAPFTIARSSSRQKRTCPSTLFPDAKAALSPAAPSATGAPLPALTSALVTFSTNASARRIDPSISSRAAATSAGEGTCQRIATAPARPVAIDGECVHPQYFQCCLRICGQRQTAGGSDRKSVA
mmetsp:Transcript_11136/g.24940  ORF Transcript_11136/g.24940 Transcript_11136/m.24940 type:complete len:210 (-) Transcript_11136:9-638(-)